MRNLSLPWLDTLPDMRVPGVPGVPPRISGDLTGTPIVAGRVPGVPPTASEHEGTPASSGGVPVKSLIYNEEHAEHLGTPVNGVVLSGQAGRWEECIRRLRGSSAPAEVREDRWSQLLGDAEQLVRIWGTKADAFGWNDIDLFGVSPGPERWLDTAGLVALLQGRPILALTTQAATIGNSAGAPNRYLRALRPQRAVLIWSDQALGGRVEDVEQSAIEKDR